MFHPTVDSQCDCHYKGTLIDGTQFDSSYDRGEPTAFAPNQVIKGWTEAMQLMVEGDKWEMYIPSDLGYGDRGSPPKIKGGDTLVFVMEIITIKGKKVRSTGYDVCVCVCMYVRVCVCVCLCVFRVKSRDIMFGTACAVSCMDYLFIHYNLESANTRTHAPLQVPAVRCNVESLEGCNEQEKTYVGTVSGWAADKVTTELARLRGMAAKGGMKPELLAWISRRTHVLQELASKAAKAEL